MTKKMPNLFMRNDTILGVCEALGKDFGFNPIWLRIALILPIFWFPLEVFALYLGLGLVVLVSRYVSPETVRQDAAQAQLPARANEEHESMAEAA